MRVVRITIAGLVGLACALVGAQVPAHAASARLAVNPGHGNGLTAFTAVYQYSASGTGGCAVRIGVWVEFTWDGIQLGQALLDPTTCGAQLRASPPRRDRAPGQHRVAAVVVGAAGSRATTSYIVEAGTPSAPPTPSRPATPSPHPAESSRAAKPPSPRTTAVAPGDGVPPSAAGVPAVLGSAAASPVPDGGDQPAWVGWALAFGGLLVLAGAGTLALVVVRTRRERVEY